MGPLTLETSSSLMSVPSLSKTAWTVLPSAVAAGGGAAGAGSDFIAGFGTAAMGSFGVVSRSRKKSGIRLDSFMPGAAR